MTQPEVSKGQEGQNPQQDKLAAARRGLNEFVLGAKPYSGRGLERGISRLQSALLAAGTSPDKAFGELGVFTRQAIDIAGAHNDTETVEALRETLAEYEAAEASLTPKKAGSTRKKAAPRKRAATPTSPQDLSPMTGAKGSK